MKSFTLEKDIFDLVEEQDKPDIFQEIESEDSAVENIKGQMADLLERFDSKDRKNENRKLSEEMKAFIRDEVAKIKPKQNVIERTIQTKIIEPKVFHVEPKVVEAPPQIIKEVRVEVQTEKKDKTKYVEESKYLDLLVKISKLEGQIREAKKMAEQPLFIPGGPGVIGIPAPEPNPVGYVLTVNSERKAQWKAATGGGGASITGYTINNPTTLKTIDLSDFTLDELGQILGSLITDLQA